MEHSAAAATHSTPGAAGAAAPATLVAVRFNYLLRMHLVEVVAVDEEIDSGLLALLYPADSGGTALYASLSHLCEGTFKFDAARLARPYRCA